MADCDQPTESQETVINIKPMSKQEWFMSLKARMDSDEGANDGQNRASRRLPKIQRVARILRKKESNKDCFEPTAVSIGPYHRHKEHLKPLEKIKDAMATQYLKAQDRPMEQLYANVEKVAAEARECYAEDATKGMSDEEFTRMMFLDGCFFLQFISGDVLMNSHDHNFVSQDLLLLENQLPFVVLEALYGSSDLVQKMEDFINNFLFLPPQQKEEQSDASAPEGSSGPVKKMVDFIRRPWCYISTAEKRTVKPRPRGRIRARRIFRPRGRIRARGKEVLSDSDAGEKPFHLLQLLRKSLLNPEDLQGIVEEGSVHRADNWHTYRSASELKKVGIHFRKSPSHRFTDVRFRTNLGFLGIQGELRLPPMTVEDSTKPILLNLAAYEKCADMPEEAADVTSYICLLNDLIDSAEDVMELRSQGILRNCLGSDQKVADLFNEIDDGLVQNRAVYAGVNQQIEKHYKNSFKIGVLERLSTYFKAPWSRVSFVAALTILVLTFLQTFYAIKQSID